MFHWIPLRILKLVCMSYELFLFIRMKKNLMSTNILVLTIYVCWYILMNNNYSTLLYLQYMHPLFHVWYLSVVDDFVFHLGLMLIPNKSRVLHLLGFSCCINFYRKDMLLLLAVIYYLIWLLLYRPLESTFLLCTFHLLIIIICLL